MPSENSEVLVVGAGPSGLAMAAALARQGISVRIIDKNASRSDKSKALGVQAGTLESLAQVFGDPLAEKMVTAGRAAREAFIHIGAAPELRVDLGMIPSRYDFVLILAQSETERIMQEELARMGVQVERQRELLSVEEREGKVCAVVRSADGKIEKVRGDYLVGCDGAHSAVRQALNLSFEGDAYEGEFILGDLEVEWDWPYEAVRTFLSPAGVLVCFPMKGERRYRLILIPRVPEAQSRIRKLNRSPEITLEEFGAIAASLCPGRLRLSHPAWLTRFSVHHRIVKDFRKGRIFLAGDAAHIHSPAGGQGMNTGIQDALNLAYKMEQVLRHEADPRLLDQYTRERLPVAKSVVRWTDFVFKLALLRESAWTGFLRRAVLPRLIQVAWIQKQVATAISQIPISRKEQARRRAPVTPRSRA